jgi:hypothetical protein
MAKSKVCAALAAAAVLLAGQARGRDVEKGRGGNEEVVDLKPAYRVQQLERMIAHNLRISPLGENDPLIQKQRQQLKKAREELAKERGRVRPGIEEKLRRSPRK